MKKSCEPNVLRRTLAEIDIRRAQDPSPLTIAALGECDGKIFHPDRDVTAVQAITDESANDAEQIKDDVGEQTERVEDAA